MSLPQISTKNVASQDQQDKSVESEKRLSFLQNEWITFCAASGMSMNEDGEFVAMSVTDFATAAGVDRTTLYYWKKSIPDFWTRVDERAREIFNQSTKFAIFKGMKLKAMAGDVKAAEFVLSHYSDYRPPAQAHEVKLSGWGDMVREARKGKIKANRPLQEAEIVEPASTPAYTPPSVPVGTQPSSPSVDNGQPPAVIPPNPPTPTPVASPNPPNLPPNPAPISPPKPQGGPITTNQPIVV